MSLLKPPELMTVKELEGSVRFHESFADMLYVLRETSESARVRETAAKYAQELQKRQPEPALGEKPSE
jgi:hypothetical protein